MSTVDSPVEPGYKIYGNGEIDCNINLCSGAVAKPIKYKQLLEEMETDKYPMVR